MPRSARRTRGFTLLELMVTVAIIGILAAVAIPAFQNYQNRSRRSEAFANLSAIAKLEKSYYSEYNVYTPAPARPGVGGLGAMKRDWTPAADADYAGIGFRPEGDVYYDYEVFIDPGACPDADCFTATAYGDVNADGAVSMIQYAQPNALGAWSPGGAFPGLGIPTDPVSGHVRLNEVAVNYAADHY